MTMFDQEPAGVHGTGRPEFIVAVAEVVNTVDVTGHARVQVALPWLPASQPWARVAVPGAGKGRGTYILPHPGDEVLVAFNRNDVTDCYVIGSLWSGADPPPLVSPLDPITKIAVRTQVGHQLTFDDLDQSITIRTSTGQTVTLDPNGITLTTTGSTASVTLGQQGDLALSAAKEIKLEAPKVTITGAAQVSVESSTNVSINGGATCKVAAATILLN